MMYDEIPSPKVTHAANLWNTAHNSHDIARALKVKEPESLRLIEEARWRGLVAVHDRYGRRIR